MAVLQTKRGNEECRLKVKLTFKGLPLPPRPAFAKPNHTRDHRRLVLRKQTEWRPRPENPRSGGSYRPQPSVSPTSRGGTSRQCRITPDRRRRASAVGRTLSPTPKGGSDTTITTTGSGSPFQCQPSGTSFRTFCGTAMARTGACPTCAGRGCRTRCTRTTWTGLRGCRLLIWADPGGPMSLANSGLS